MIPYFFQLAEKTFRRACITGCPLGIPYFAAILQSLHQFLVFLLIRCKTIDDIVNKQGYDHCKQTCRQVVRQCCNVLEDISQCSAHDKGDDTCPAPSRLFMKQFMVILLVSDQIVVCQNRRAKRRRHCPKCIDEICKEYLVKSDGA